MTPSSDTSSTATSFLTLVLLPLSSWRGLAFGGGLRDDLGHLFGSLETGGEPVLRQGPRDARCGVGARVAPADAPDSNHAPGLLRVCSDATDRVTQRPGRREAHDLIDSGERPGRDLTQPFGRDQLDAVNLM